jgi:hypothetical protein
MYFGQWISVFCQMVGDKKKSRGLRTFLMVKGYGVWGIDIMHNAELQPSDYN